MARTPSSYNFRQTGIGYEQFKASSTLATGDSRRRRRQFVAFFGDKLSPYSATIVASVDEA